MRELVTLMLSFSMCSQVFSLEANVLHTGTWGTGGLFIQLSTTYDLAGCPSPEIWVDGLHPNKEQILSVAMAAVASGKKLEL